MQINSDAQKKQQLPIAVLHMWVWEKQMANTNLKRPFKRYGGIQVLILISMVDLWRCSFQ